MTFKAYVEFKLAQHARVMERARQNRNNKRLNAEYLAQAAMVRAVLAKDMATQ